MLHDSAVWLSTNKLNVMNVDFLMNTVLDEEYQVFGYNYELADSLFIYELQLFANMQKVFGSCLSDGCVC